MVEPEVSTTKPLEPSRVARLLGTDPGPPLGPVYALTTSTSALVALLVSDGLGIIALWAVVSAVVVIQPEVRASVRATGLRAVANVIGAGVGALLSLSPVLPQVPSLVLGLCLVALACRLLGIDIASRSASVAVTIVLLRGPDALDTSRSRVLGVLLGCAVALVVTGLFGLGQRGVATLARWRRGRGDSA